MEVQLNDCSKSGAVVVKAGGRIDALSAPDFEEKIKPLLESEYTNLILEFSDLEYISSAGLRAILKMAQGCKKTNRKLFICGLIPSVHEVFKISGFDLILNIQPDLDTVLSSI